MSVAERFPGISTGAYRYPRELAADVAVRECRAFLESCPSFDRVLLVAFSDEDAEVVRTALPP